MWRNRARVYFVIVWVVGVLIMINVAIATILQQYNDEQTKKKSEINPVSFAKSFYFLFYVRNF